MPTRFVPDVSADDVVDGIDKRYYEKQVPPSSPFRDNSFELAAARAKDRARAMLVKAVRAKEETLRDQSFSGLHLAGDFSLSDDFSETARRDVLAHRSIDGVKGAPDDDIKL